MGSAVESAHDDIAARCKPRWEERDRHSGVHRARIRPDLDRHGHQAIVRRHVEKFPAVSPPPRIDLASSRDPAAIRRKLALDLVEARLQDRKWLAFSREWQSPQVGAGFQILDRVEQHVAIRRPILWPLVLGRHEELLLVGGAIGQFLEEHLPLRLDRKIMRLPSGDQMGWMSRAGSDVKRSRMPRARSNSQMSVFPWTTRATANRRPSSVSSGSTVAIGSRTGQGASRVEEAKWSRRIIRENVKKGRKGGKGRSCPSRLSWLSGLHLIKSISRYVASGHSSCGIISSSSSPVSRKVSIAGRTTSRKCFACFSADPLLS